MLIRHLTFFVALAREGHFAKAAKACNITQPTLSAALRKLEEDFGARLVVRGQHFEGLTPEGERVLAWGQQIISDYESLKDDMTSVGHGLSGTLRLGVVPAAMPVVSFVTEGFRKVHPAASIEILSMSSRQIQSGLDSLELHGGITYLENEPLERVFRLPLYRERYVVVARRDRFSGNAPIDWRTIVDCPLCLLGTDLQNRRILDSIARIHGVSLKPAVVSNSYLAICSHLRRGDWISVVPHTLPYVFGLAPELAAYEIAGCPPAQSLGVVTPNRRPLAKMTNALFDVVARADIAADIEAARLHCTGPR